MLVAILIVRESVYAMGMCQIEFRPLTPLSTFFTESRINDIQYAQEEGGSMLWGWNPAK